jgi:molybdopterin converting factor small subunit
MAVTVLIPTALRSFTGRNSEASAEGGTVADVIAHFAGQYPDVRGHLYDDGGALRPYINVFIGETNVKNLQGAGTPVKDGDTVTLVPAIAGGGGPA